MALSSMQLFMGQLAASPPESLKIRVLQIIFDLLMVHDRVLVSHETNIVNDYIISHKMCANFWFG
jgi:condensin complex subunit 3